MSTSKVNWREWSEATFAEAKAQDKPVLLGISAVWCHWCHVMDRGTPGDATHTGTYSADDIAGYINQNFIPVRVDNDQRPDINARYNMGGWPTTCFLTPDGDVIYGGTYFAPSQMRGLLQQVLQYWTNRRDELEAQLKERSSDERRVTSDTSKRESFDIRHSHLDIVEILIRNYDKRNGGLGGGQKFPMSDAWELLLAVYAQTGEEQLLEMVSQTLISMGTKGMYDTVAGGFFRYSTTPDWSVPHFEKMLEDHGRLLTVYLHAIQTTRGKAHTQPLAEVLEKVARTALEYLTTTLLYDKLGLTYFAGSQDADEEYYLLSKSERAEKPAPFIDWRLYADWNALMVNVLFLAADALREPRFAALAEKVLTTLVRLCLNEDGSVTHSVTIDEAAGLQHMLHPAPLRGQLGDQAALAKACIEQVLRGETEARLYGRNRLEIAGLISAYAIRHLSAPEGGFYDSPENPEALGMLKVRLKPIFDNAAMSDVLLMLAKMDVPNPESGSYAEMAQQTLAAFVDEVARYREHGSPYALAVMRAASEPTEVMIVAEAKDAPTFVQAACNHYALWRIVRVLDPKQDAALIAQRGFPTSKLPVAFVCKGTTCSAPIFDVETLGETI
jgi:uncharacterized protein YyaL (SSP411 family)